jgi:hypothetical protein
MTLAKASEEMEPIMGKRVGFAVVCKLDYRVTTLRKGSARCLINRVNSALLGDSRLPSVQARLEAEFAAMKE